MIYKHDDSSCSLAAIRALDFPKSSRFKSRKVSEGTQPTIKCFCAKIRKKPAVFPSVTSKKDVMGFSPGIEVKND